MGSAIVLDLDGTLWLENSPIKGASEFLTKLIDTHIPFALLSNTGENTALSISKKVKRVVDCTISPACIWTALDNMCQELDNKVARGEVDDILIIARSCVQLSEHAFFKCARPFTLEPDGSNTRQIIACFTDGVVEGVYADVCVAIADYVTRGAQLYITSDDDTLFSIREGVRCLKPGPGILIQNVKILRQRN
jgi:ribonucleotide monophosphatase NagD (HAD superfamily)